MMIAIEAYKRTTRLSCTTLRILLLYQRMSQIANTLAVLRPCCMNVTTSWTILIDMMSIWVHIIQICNKYQQKEVFNTLVICGPNIKTLKPWCNKWLSIQKRESRLKQDNINLHSFLKKSVLRTNSSYEYLVSKFLDDVQYWTHNALSSTEAVREILIRLDQRRQKRRSRADGRIQKKKCSPNAPVSESHKRKTSWQSCC